MTDPRILKRLEDLEKRVQKLEGQKKIMKAENSEFKGLTGSILSLVKDGFFDAPKELGEIYKQLRANAVFYPKTSYPDSLLRLVKHKKLRRLQESGKWKYVKY